MAEEVITKKNVLTYEGLKKLEDELYRLFKSQTEDTRDENWQEFLKKSVEESEKKNNKHADK